MTYEEAYDKLHKIYHSTRWTHHISVGAEELSLALQALELVKEKGVSRHDRTK